MIHSTTTNGPGGEPQPNWQMLATTTRMTFKTEDYVTASCQVCVWSLTWTMPQKETDSSIQLSFSEPILSESLNAENSLCWMRMGKVSWCVQYERFDAVFTPSSALIISGNTASKSAPGLQTSAEILRWFHRNIV